MLAGSTRPSTSFSQQIARYGEAFGIDGTTSKAVVDQTIGSSTGGTVVRSEQTVDGVPVFGGEVVMSLDHDQDVVSIDASTTAATDVDDAVVSEARARRTALAVVAKAHRVAIGTLSVTDRGRHLYDPALVHVTDPGGARPVWQFEVRNGFDVRETVLVGTDRGEVALHFNNAPGINRLVCDNADVASSAEEVPRCTTGVDRREGGAASPVAEVNAAYDNLGVTSDVYADLDGIDLTEKIGTPVQGQKRLMATVRWCFADVQCPYPNAFWDGTQMVFGTGYATADDVVGHELTHGYVEKTAGLFALNQSGALDESLADTIGEIVDHRNPASTENDDDWVVGEDLPGAGTSRSMQDPTLNDFPDRMTSANFVTSELVQGSDGVHENGGVGNKTAYLISQGGTFNGQADHRHRQRRSRPVQDRPALPRGDQAAHLRRPVRRPRPCSRHDVRPARPGHDRSGARPRLRAVRLRRGPRRRGGDRARVASDRPERRPRRGSAGPVLRGRGWCRSSGTTTPRAASTTSPSSPRSCGSAPRTTTPRRTRPTRRSTPARA